MESITIKPCVNPITSTTGGCSNGAVAGLANGGYGLRAVEEISSFARVDNTKKGTHTHTQMHFHSSMPKIIL